MREDKKIAYPMIGKGADPKMMAELAKGDWAHPIDYRPGDGVEWIIE